jgi:hypothetical protein
MMSHKYQLTTVAESNDKGSWFGWDIHKVGMLDLSQERDLFDMAVEFAKSVKAGEVEVKETPETPQKQADDDSPF